MKGRIRTTLGIIFFLASIVFSANSTNDESESSFSTYCFDASKITWINGKDGRILMRDDRGGIHKIRIKGTSWSGFDTQSFSLVGLNESSMETILNSLQEKGFNAIRVPISMEFALWRKIRVAEHTDICNEREMASMQLHRLFIRAAAHGLLVILDLQNLQAKKTKKHTKLHYIHNFNEDDFFRAWDGILFDYLVHPNFFALDPFDGPLDSSEWKHGHLGYEETIRKFTNMLSNGHISKNTTRWFKGLVLLKPLNDIQVQISDTINNPQWKQRIVYSPQIFSLDDEPFTWDQIEHNAPSEVFQEKFGFMELKRGHAIVVTSWDRSETNDESYREKLIGFKGDKFEEAQFVNLVAEWLRASGLTDMFLELAPEDNGIMAESWMSFASCRLDLINRINPHPTVFAHINTDVICVSDWGRDANLESMLPNYTGLDCTNPNNSQRCITCFDEKSKKELEFNKSISNHKKEKSKEKHNCVPWGFYEDLNSLDERDSDLKILSTKLSNIMANGGKESSQTISLKQQLSLTLEDRSHSRKAIMRNYAIQSFQSALLLSKEAEKLKSLVRERKSSEKENFSEDGENFRRGVSKDL